MLNFTFQNPTKLIFGKEQVKLLSQEIPKAAKILMTYGGGSIKKNGVYDQVKNALAGYNIIEFGGIEPNPTYETLMKAVELARKEKIDFLLAVGGGSVLDGTKFIAVAINYPGDAWQLIVKAGFGGVAPEVAANTVPLASVLTLPATGSEMNSGAVISRKETGDKLAFMNSHAFPQFSILDPTYTFTLPLNQTANGIVDAYIHTMEQYLTYSVNAPLQDRMAEGILLSLIEEAPKVMKNREDYDARANIMFCATMALNDIISMGVPQDWATHLIGHELTALTGLDHGQTLAIIMPSMMSVKRDTKGDKIIQYGERIFNITSGDRNSRIDQAINKTREFFESLGVKTRLSQYGIDKAVIPKIIKKLEQHGMIAIGEKQDITLEVSQKILEQSF